MMPPGQVDDDDAGGENWCADTLMHHGSPEAGHNCVPVSALVSGPWHGQFSGAQQPWVSWRNWPGLGGDTEILRIQ